MASERKNAPAPASDKGFATLAPLWRDLKEQTDATALLAFTDEDAVRFSRGELDRQSRALAHGLRARDLLPGDRVALFANNRPEWLQAAAGVLRAGLVLVPIDAQSRGDQLEHILGDSDPSLLLLDRKTERRLEKLDRDDNPAAFRIDQDDEDHGWSALLAEDGDGEALPQPEPDDTAVLFYTSGTTGPPKGVPLSQRNLGFQMETLQNAGIVRSDDRMLAPLPLHHVYPFVIGFLAPLVLRIPIIHPHSLTGPQLVRAAREGEATILLGVPRLLRELSDGVLARSREKGRFAAATVAALLKTSSALHRAFGWSLGKALLAPLHRQIGPRLRMLVSGGSLLPPEVGHRLQALGWQVAIGYGLTETAPLLTINRPGRNRLETLGQPVDGIELRCNVDARPEDADDDSFRQGEGEIQAKGPGVFQGYRNLEEETEDAFTDDGYFRTGDMGWFDDEGDLRYSGRLSTLIVTEGGENLRPEDVEDAYAKEPEIDEFAVLQVDNKLVGIAVPDYNHIGSDDDAEDAVRQAVDRRSSELASYQRVNDLAVTSQSLPRTRLGKPRRHQLEQRFRDAKEGKDDADASPIPVEEMDPQDQSLLDDPAAEKTWDFLVERYADRPLRPDSRLASDLGIDSLAWMNLTLELQERAGAALDEETIERLETVRDLLREIGQSDERETEGFDLNEHPEKALTDEQREWLRPLSSSERRQLRLGFRLHRGLQRIAFRPRAEGLDRLPDEGPFVLAPNHISYLDAPTLAALLPWETLRQARWAGGANAISTNRLVAKAARLAGAVPVRGGPSAIAFGLLALREGRPLIWFPEGSISDDGSLLPFQPGLGMILEREPATVLPVRMRGTRRALPKGKRFPRPLRTGLLIGKPVRSDQLEKEGEGDEPHERITDGLRQRLEALS